MVIRSISQIPVNGKVENNSYINSLAASNKKSKNPLYRQSGMVLSMSNDEAVQFLRENGFAQIIPGTHFATIHDYARFLGIKTETLQSYLYRYGLDTPKNPKETLSSSLEYFFRCVGLAKVGKFTVVKKNSARGVFDFCFEKQDTHYVTEWTNYMKFVSARTVLGVLPFIAAWQKKYRTDHESVVLLNKLVALLNAKEEAEAKKRAEDEARKKTEILAREHGNKADALNVSEDVLYQLIKKAVSEVMSGAKISLVAPDVNT